MQRRVIDLGVVPAVDGQSGEQEYSLDVGRGDGGGEAGFKVRRVGGIDGLDDEKAMTVVGNEGGAADFGEGHGDAFDGEGIEAAVAVVDSGAAASGEPETSGCIERTGVTGAVPGFSFDLELRFGVAVASEVALENVIAGDHDFPGWPQRAGAPPETYEQIQPTGLFRIRLGE